MEATEKPTGPDRLEWYACYTRGRHEKRVGELLTQRGFEVFLPVVSRLRKWHDRDRLVEFPLFPSYVFTRTSTRNLGQALATPGLVDVVKFASRPVTIPDQEIESIRLLSESLPTDGPEPELGPPLDAGEAVRVVTGPFKGVRGLVAEMRGNRRVMLFVGVSAIGQGIRVEVDRADVESTPN